MVAYWYWYRYCQFREDNTSFKCMVLKAINSYDLAKDSRDTAMAQLEPLKRRRGPHLARPAYDLALKGNIGKIQVGFATDRRAEGFVTS